MNEQSAIIHQFPARATGDFCLNDIRNHHQSQHQDGDERKPFPLCHQKTPHPSLLIAMKDSFEHLHAFAYVPQTIPPPSTNCKWILMELLCEIGTKTVYHGKL